MARAMLAVVRRGERRTVGPDTTAAVAATRLVVRSVMGVVAVHLVLFMHLAAMLAVVLAVMLDLAAVLARIAGLLVALGVGLLAFGLFEHVLVA